MAQLKKTVSITNGSQTVSLAGDYTDQIKQNFIFMVEGELTPYTVAADAVYDTGTKRTSFTLAGAYAGSTNPIAAGVVVTDYTFPDLIPVIRQGDVGTAAVFTQAMYRLQEMILQASPEGLAQFADMRDEVAADQITVHADALAVAADKTTAQTAATSAAASATAAAASQASLTAALHSFNQKWLGESATDPIVDGNGDALAEGAEYYNTVSNKIRIYVDGAWVNHDADVQTATANANTAATNAAASAAAAATSASGASTSAGTATTKAGEAAASATAAGTSETNALASKNAASTSATNAATSETNAGTSASQALTSKNDASTSAAAALASQNKAHDWAEKADGVAVDPGEYSAKHWAHIAQGAAASAVAGGVSTVNGRTGAVVLTSADVSLGNVENKSSATIRSEITSANVTAGLGFTPLSNTATTDAVAEGAGNKYFTEARVRAAVLTGIDLATATAVTAADSVMSAIGKLWAKIAAHVARTDNPHAVTAAQVGLGSVENKSSATIRSELTGGNVTTALGYTPLSNAATTTAVAEGTNLYFTEARVRSSLLTGLSTAAGTVVTAAHSVLQAIGFLQKQVSDNTTNIGTNTTAIGANTTAIAGKQATLVSGTNIKTINGANVLGAGDLVINAGMTLAQVQATALSF